MFKVSSATLKACLINEMTWSTRSYLSTRTTKTAGLSVLHFIDFMHNFPDILNSENYWIDGNGGGQFWPRRICFWKFIKRFYLFISPWPWMTYIGLNYTTRKTTTQSQRKRTMWYLTQCKEYISEKIIKVKTF